MENEFEGLVAAGTFDAGSSSPTDRKVARVGWM